MRRIVSALALLAVVLGVYGCSNSANSNDKKTATRDLKQFQASQPAPQFKWSQLRQTLIDVETAQAHGVQTTSFFFNLGDTTPIGSCPSIGFPIATTTQLTNPQQEQDGASIAAIDPSGVYAGDSTGTYVICIAPNGSTYAYYWEGYVGAVSGPAVWDATKHEVRLTGPTTAKLYTAPGLPGPTK